MPKLPNPIEDEDEFDTFVLGGVRSPGVVKFSGHDRKIGWDVKTAKGQKGASTELKDIPPIEFTAEIYLADLDDFAAWPEFFDLFNSTIAGATPKALDIYHPDLAEQEIRSVVKAGTAGTRHDGKGGMTKVLKFQEYSPPLPKSGSPSGSSADGKRAREQNDPNAAAKAELKALVGQYESTPWG